MWRNRQNRQFVGLRAIMPENAPGSGRVILNIRVEDFFPFRALQRTVLVRLKGRVEGICLEKPERLVDLLQLGSTARRFETYKNALCFRCETQLESQGLDDSCVVVLVFVIVYRVLAEIAEVFQFSRSALCQSASQGCSHEFVLPNE